MDEPSDYLRRLPIGERMPLGELAEDPLFPFEGESTSRRSRSRSCPSRSATASRSVTVGRATAAATGPS